MVIERPYRVFCCSAHEDQEFLQHLRMHLKPLERERLVEIRTDLDISAGAEWKQAVDRYLDMAEIILLLISPSFMASDSCFHEANKAISRRKQGRAYVVPIIIRPTDWRNTSLGELLCLPREGKPVSLWPNTDTALLSVAEEIRMLVQKSPMSIYSDEAKEKQHMPPIQEDPLFADGRGRPITKTTNYNISNSSGNAIGDNAQVHIHGNQNIVYGNQKDGIGSLGKGAKALWNGEYSTAKKDLGQAIEYIDSDKQPEEASKAHYLLALASLGGKLPRSQGKRGMESIEELMKSAIRLYACTSYYRIFACIKKDLFEYTRLRSHLNEAYIFENTAASLPRQAIDDENERFFQHCEPRLLL